MRISPYLIACVFAMVPLTAPTTAQACGGTFCDAPGQQVNQTGEVIAFVLDGSKVEAHIQIQYDPNTLADQFAWLVPVQQVPSFRVGSDPLFQNLLNGTVPTYQVTNNFESGCGGTGFATTGVPTTTDPTGFGSDTDPTTGDPPPDVVLEQTVGAFDVVVLEGGTVDSLMMWLAANGYQQDAAAAPILQEYLDEGFRFVAFKLSQQAGVDAIHPVVLEYEGDEPCVPIRLTRIAAEEDMQIRAFFLGNNRTVPTNYRHVVVNHVKIDWFNLQTVAEQYTDLITQAVDAFKADGHAFVTEYAGTSSVVPRVGITDPKWQSSVFPGSAAVDAIHTLEAQDILRCDNTVTCFYYHPLIESLLTQYLPVPDGLSAAEFYSCLECYPDLIDVDAWGDGSGFAAAYENRIVDPGKRADALLDTWPYLTRLFTTISPGEMTEDPIFHQNPSLANVDNLILAERETLCDGGVLMTIPPGREIYVPGGGMWPEFAGEMPYTHEVQTVALEGAPQVLVDNEPVIVDLIDQWNRAHGWPMDTGTTGDPASTSGSHVDGGCGCRSTTPAQGTLALTLACIVLGWTRRGTHPH